MQSSDNLTCPKHSSPYVALCYQCNEGLCIDCLFDHKSFKDHEYEKLSKLKEKWITDLNKLSISLKEMKESTTPINKNKEKPQAEILKESLLKLDKIQAEIKSKIDLFFAEYKQQLTIFLKSDTETKEQQGFNFEFPPSCFSSKKEEIAYFIKKLESDSEADVLKLLKYLNQNKYKESLEADKNKTGNDALDFQIKTNMHLFCNEAIFFKIQEVLTQNISFSYDSSTTKRLLAIEEKKSCTILPWFFENTNFLLIYDVKDRKVMQYQLKDFIVPFNYRCIATKNNLIYLIGGVKPDTEKSSNEVFSFDSKNNTMRAKFNMKESRYGHALCYITVEKEEYIYCIGGRSEEGRLSSVERYNINENSWKKIQKLHFPRVGACACGNKKNIYVFGGMSEKETINKIVEIYKINEDKWEFYEVKNTVSFDPCIDSSCIFLNENDILIVGGAKRENNEVWFTNHMNFYNVEQNTIFVNSGFKEDFPFYFLGDNLTIYEKNLFMMIKFRSESKKYGPFQKAIICFDFARNQWKFDQLVEYDVN